MRLYTVQEVIQVLGFPDTQESINVSYPKTVQKDCISYTPVFDRKKEFGNGNASAIHYHYDSKYPGLVITFVDGRVRCLSLKGRTYSPLTGLALPVPALHSAHNARSFSEGIAQGCGAGTAAVFLIATVLYLFYALVS
jgi:hypothetical protein